MFQSPELARRYLGATVAISVALPIGVLMFTSGGPLWIAAPMIVTMMVASTEMYVQRRRVAQASVREDSSFVKRFVRTEVRAAFSYPNLWSRSQWDQAWQETGWDASKAMLVRTLCLGFFVCGVATALVMDLLSGGG
jgi:hypothetical protein